MNRRDFVRLGGASAGLLALARSAKADSLVEGEGGAGPSAVPAVPSPGGVVTPNGSALSWKTVGRVKVGHLIAEEVDHEFAPGLRARCLGYNGSTPGPTIEGTVGERIRIYVTNRLKAPTSVHWHGLILPNGMDGVSGLTQKAIPPGKTYVYEFALRHAGTFMYHPHYDEMTQIAFGMVGMFIVHPAGGGQRVDHDFAMMLHEWKIDVGARRADPGAMNDFNLLTFNSKAFPATAPLLVGQGKRVRIRLGNLGPMDHHPIHLHGLNFRVTETDGGAVPASAQHPDTTVLVPVGATRVIEFTPTEAGDWPVHCHMTHHIMNQMAHGLPNVFGADLNAFGDKMRKLVPGYMNMGMAGMGGMAEMGMKVPDNSIPMVGGPGPFGYIDMGGMFTILKVRRDVATADPSGWYEHPSGTVSREATAEELSRDGVG